MKNFISIIIGCLVVSTLTSIDAFAITGSTSSNPETDIFASDSIRLHPEEAARTDLIHGSKVIFVNGDEGNRADRDSVERMLERFYVDQFRNSQDPEAPYFTFMSKDANYAMGIGGIAAIDAWFNWNGYIPYDGYNVSNIEIPKSPERMKSIGATAAYSKIYLNIMGKNTPIGSFRVYLEAGFTDSRYSKFRIKRAWMQIRDFTVGLAKSTFSDPAAQPETLDPAGPNGKIDRANILVRYLHTWKNKWSVGGSVEFPGSYYKVEDKLTAKVSDYVPDFAALGQFQWNRGLSHVRIGGIVRAIPYRDLIAGQNHTVLGWGAELSSIVRAGRILTFYYLSSVGKGIASYTADLGSEDCDLLPDLSTPGRMYAPLTLATTVGIKVQILPKLSSTISLSGLHNYAKGNIDDATYKYGEYICGNLIYTFSPRLMTGLEYLAAKRMNFNGQHANANRLSAKFVFSF